MIVDRPAGGFDFGVAKAEGQIAGLATDSQFRFGPGYATGVQPSVILAPEAQGKGFFCRLMGAIEVLARAGGAQQMIAGVSGKNAAGIAFHAAFGHDEIAPVSEAGFKFGRGLDLVLLRKFLT